MRFINLRGRDTARTPMQWDDSENAGFTTGTPWIKVNPNYKEINAADQMADPDSVFHYYKKLIALRKQEDVIVYGDYQLLAPESETLYAYTRTLEREDGTDELLVICSFAGQEETFEIPEKFLDGEILIGNGRRESVERRFTLAPYEAIAILKR